MVVTEHKNAFRRKILRGKLNRIMVHKHAKLIGYPKLEILINQMLNFLT